MEASLIVIRLVRWIDVQIVDRWIDIQIVDRWIENKLRTTQKQLLANMDGLIYTFKIC